MTKPMKYHLKGVRQRLGSEVKERFDTFVIATGYDDAQTTARDNWRSEWHNVVFTYAAQDL